MRLLAVFILSAVCMSVLYSQEAAEPEVTAPAPAAEENGPGWQEHTIFRVGLSVGLTGVKVLDGSKELGTLQSPGDLKPLLGYDSKAYYFGMSNFGFFFSSDYGTINIHKQQVGISGEFEDIGTYFKGFYAYGAPVLFYNWGDRTFRNTKDLRLRVGLGLGASYLNLEGNIIYTETADTSKHSISMTGFHLAPVFMVEYRWGSWILRSTAHYMWDNRDGRTYTFIDGAVDIGYTMVF